MPGGRAGLAAAEIKIPAHGVWPLLVHCHSAQFQPYSQRKRLLVLISCLNFSETSVAARRPARPKSVLNSENSADPFPATLMREIIFPTGSVTLQKSSMLNCVGGHVNIDAEFDDVDISGAKMKDIPFP